MESLIYLTPLGLALDVVGFWLVIQFGHTIFFQIFDKEEDLPEIAKRQPGRLYAWVADPDQENQSITPKSSELRRIAWVGVSIVIIGFVFQIIGFVSMVAIT